MSWLVERSRDVFEVFEFESIRLHESGAVEFYDGSIFQPRNRLILAPGQWISVCEDADS